jgi:hypothetical protein
MRDQQVNDRRPPLPSSNRTCGFPASGFRRALLREAFARAIGSCLAFARSFARLSPSFLTAALQREFAAAKRCVVDQIVFRSISAGDSLSPLRSCQGPFAPRALPRFIATMGLSDSPAPSTCLMDSTRAWSPLSRPPAAGVSQSAQPNLPCALPPSTPEVPVTAYEHLFMAGNRLRLI